MLVLPRLRPIIAGMLALVVGVTLTTWQANIAVAAGNTRVLYSEAHSFQSDPISVGPLYYGAACKGKAWWEARRDDFGINPGVVEYSLRVTAACSSAVNYPGASKSRTFSFAGYYENTTDPCRFNGGGEMSDKSGVVSMSWRDSLPQSTAIAGYKTDPSYEGPPVPIAKPVCVPNELRVTGASSTDWFVDLEMPPLPVFGDQVDHSGTCPFGRPDSIERTVETRTISGVAQYRLTAIVHATSDPLVGSSWRIRGVRQNGSTYSGQLEPDGATSAQTLTAGTEYSWRPDSTAWRNYDDPGYIGFQVYRTAAGAADGGNTQSYGTGPYGDKAGLNATGKGFGDTAPGVCTFWFGPKVFDLEDSTLDDPFGSGGPDSGELTPPPVDDLEPPTPPVVGDPDEACNFDIGDPSSWVSAGVCALVGMLKLLIEAVVAIPMAIFALVETLLIPNPSAWGTEELISQFEARPPGSVVMSVGQAAKAGADSYSGSGSCSLFTIEGASVTCDSVKEVPGYSALYSLVQLGLIALTGLAIFRIFAGTFSDESGG